MIVNAAMVAIGSILIIAGTIITVTWKVHWTWYAYWLYVIASAILVSGIYRIYRFKKENTL